MPDTVALTVCLCQVFIFLGALAILTEVSISMARGPCESWPLSQSTPQCPFQSYGSVCGLMNDIRVNDRDNFYFYGSDSTCVASLTIASAAILLSVALCCLQLRALFTKLGYLQDETLMTLHTTTMMSGVVWLCCLMLMAATTGGYATLCQSMGTPPCNNSIPYNAYLGNCHTSKYELIPCARFGPESFTGRLAVAMGFSWVAFVAASVAAVAVGYYQWNMQKSTKARKPVYGAEANQQALEAHYAYLDAIEGTNHQSPDQSVQYNKDDEIPNSEEVSQGYLVNSSLSYRPLPTLPSTDRVEDVMIAPADARTRPSKRKKNKRSDFQENGVEYDEDLKESSF